MSILRPCLALSIALALLLVGNEVAARGGLSSEASCLTGWETWDGNCLLVETGREETWEGASQACRDLGGELFASSKVQQLQEMLLETYGSSKRFWVGASDIEQEGSWHWTGGQRVASDVWMPNQPNNCCGGEDCAVLGTEWPAPLNDNSCRNKRNFVCSARASLPRALK